MEVSGTQPIRCSSCGAENPTDARFCGRCGAALETIPTAQPAATVPTTAAAPPTMDYAGFWLRVGAWAIDSVVLWAAIGLISLFVSLMLPGFARAGVYVGIGIAVISMSVLLLGPSLYYWLFTGLKGQTLGKMAVGIRVVDYEGHVPGLGRAGWRELGWKFVSAIVFLLGFLWIGWDSKKQGWHDKLSKTYVVKAGR